MEVNREELVELVSEQIYQQLRGQCTVARTGDVVYADDMRIDAGVVADSIIDVARHRS